MAKLEVQMKAIESRRAALDARLKSLPSAGELQTQSQQVQAKTHALPTAAELRREAVGIKPDGSHVDVGKIPPTVLRRLHEELGLSPQQLRKLND